MRKILSLLLFGVGGFLLVAAILLLVWVPGKVKATPLDTNSDTRLVGEAQYQKEDRTRVEAYSLNRTLPNRSSDDVAVFEVETCLWKDPGDSYDNCPDPKGSKKDKDAFITAGDDVFAADRRSGESIGNYENLPKGAVPHKGLVNKFPFDTEKKTYKFWDGVLGEPVDAEFKGEETLQGLKVYKFVVAVKDRPATVTTIGDKDIKGTYSTDKTMWVDPVTGAIQKQQEKQQRKLENGDNAIDLDFEFTPATVKKNVADAKENGDKLSTVSKAPWFLLVLGLVALLAGFLLARGGGRTRRADDAGRDDDTDLLDDVRPRSRRHSTD